MILIRIINSFISYFIIYTFLNLLINNFSKQASYQEKLCIRIVNNTVDNITNISLYSHKFKDLDIGEKSHYKIFKFDNRTDDPMLYLKTNNNNFALYLSSPDSMKGNYSYIIDSVNIFNGYIYIRELKSFE